MERQDAKAARPEPAEEIDRVAYATIGAAIEVHRTLGPGFIESIYEEAFAVELRLRGLAFDRQLRVPIFYKQASIGEHVLDFVVDGLVVVELKAIERIAAVHCAQVHSYLRAGVFQLGLLINFNVPMLKQGLRRIIKHAEGEQRPLF